MMELKVEMKVMMMEILCNKMEAAQKMNRRPREACKWPPVTQKGPTNWNYDEDGVLVTVPSRVHWFRAVDKFVAELHEENNRLDLELHHIFGSGKFTDDVLREHEMMLSLKANRPVANFNRQMCRGERLFYSCCERPVLCP